MTRWPTATIGSACTVFSGGTPSKGNSVYWRGTIPWVSAKDLKADRIFDAELHISQQACDESAAKMAPVGSLLMLVRGMGLANGIQVGEVTAPVAFNQDLRAIVPPPGVDSRFLLLALRHRLADGGKGVLSSAAHGTLKIDADALRQVEFPVPPPKEQRRIVAILDEAFKGIATAKANAEKNLQSARDLVGTGYQTIVGSFDQSQWGKAPVADLAAASKGSMRTGPFGSQLLHSEFVDDGIAVLGIDNAVANEFRWDKRRYITEAKYQDLSRYRVHPGDVLITIMGTCGRCAVVPDDIPLAINTKHLCCITLDREKCLPDYLHLYFLHDPLARAYLADQAKGSIMAGLNMGIISALPVRLPPLDQQANIVERFNSLHAECDRLADVQARKLTALDELKHSLLHQAFTGGLSPQNDRPPQGHGLLLCTQ